MTKLRCPSRLHGILKDSLLEVKCRSVNCGASAAVQVFHYFDPLTGELVDTKKYRDPQSVQQNKEASCR